jgi:predicted nicotinamide N-methyase
LFLSDADYNELNLKVNGKSFTFKIPKDPIDILERELLLKGEERAIPPYWAEHWPSADTAIKNILDLLKNSSKNGAVLELGSGIGIIASILAKNGYNTIASDYSEDACNLIVKNSELNRCRLKTVCFDWNSSTVKKQFETIIGIDILYDENQYKIITNFLTNNLSANGIAIIFDPNRPHWQDFKNELTENNFSFKTVLKEIGENLAIIEAIEIRKTES